MFPRTLDGRPLTMGVSGFDHYNNELTDPPSEVPNLTISPADLMAQINLLSSTINQPALKEAIKQLQEHIASQGNPHNTQFSDYLDDIVDVLYDKFIELGGTGDKDHFVECLFTTLRIATLNEMYDERNGKLLISIRGAQQFIDRHELDPEAHQGLLEQVYPGDAPSYDPSLSVQSYIGISDEWLESLVEEDETYTTVPYTYVGIDRVLYSCDDCDELPCDYSHEIPMWPCFGTKTNQILNSDDFTQWDRLHVGINRDDTCITPMANLGCDVIRTVVDDDPVEHYFIIPRVRLEPNQAHTFSIFAKPGTCRYVVFSYRDMTITGYAAVGVFDLVSGKAIALNGWFMSTSVEIVNLSNDWCRCAFTMLHESGETSDLKVIFFKDDELWDTMSKSTSASADWEFAFQGDDEICGYVWGAQLEVGSLSPYMPSDDRCARRYPIRIRVPLDDRWWCPDDSTLYFSYLAPNVIGEQSTQDHRYLFTITDDDGLAADAWYDTSATLRLQRYSQVSSDGQTVDTVVFQDIFSPQNQQFHQFTHAISNREVVSLLNDTSGLNIVIPTDWSKGNILYVGNNGGAEYLESYIRSFEIYPQQATMNEAIFFNGEEIYE